MQVSNASSNVLYRTKMTDLFLEFAEKIFADIDYIEGNCSDIDYRGIHKRLSEQIKIALNENVNKSFNQDFKEVIYAMASLADELFLNLNWEGKTFWENAMLEQVFFSSQFAGEEIFYKIDDLFTNRNKESVEKAEIYLKLLSLGFLGKYRGAENEEKNINEYRYKLYEYITAIDKSICEKNCRIFQKEYTFTLPSIHRKLLPDASIISYASAFAVFVMIIISTTIWFIETQQTREMIASIIHNITQQE